MPHRSGEHRLLRLRYAGALLAAGGPGRENVAHTAMLQAGKVLAATAIDLIEDPDLLAKAKAEHSGRVGDGYVCPIPKGVKPRAMGKPGK